MEWKTPVLESVEVSVDHWTRPVAKAALPEPRAE